MFAHNKTTLNFMIFPPHSWRIKSQSHNIFMISLSALCGSHFKIDGEIFSNQISSHEEKWNKIIIKENSSIKN